ncbi:MAG: HNH endonuclease signature motif containing protein [Cyanobacteria bacterium P01_H01_bin.121]
MSRSKIPDQIKKLVRSRAAGLCEYCHAVEQWQYVQFTLDHIQPVSRGGDNSAANLALACMHCNRRKSNHVMALDPETGQEVSLFNPRQDCWTEHFIWSADTLLLEGVTPTGRATVAALGINRSWAVAIRAADLQVRRHPPPGDPKQSS